MWVRGLWREREAEPEKAVPFDVQVADAVFAAPEAAAVEAVASEPELKSIDVQSIGVEGMPEGEEYGEVVKADAKSRTAEKEVETVLVPPPTPEKINQPFSGDFIETLTGFLRLSAVKRFEVFQHRPDCWHLGAYGAENDFHPIGEFGSESEAREAGRKLCEGAK